MPPPSSRSGMAPRLALLCWGYFVVLRFRPGFSLVRELCIYTSRLTPLSATMALKQPMDLPWRVRVYNYSVSALSSLLAILDSDTSEVWGLSPQMMGRNAVLWDLKLKKYHTMHKHQIPLPVHSQPILIPRAPNTEALSRPLNLRCTRYPLAVSVWCALGFQLIPFQHLVKLQWN